MHTTHSNDTTFIHRGDYSGIVIIRHGGVALEVPAEDLLDFAAEYVRQHRIRQLEEASVDEMLGTLETKHGVQA